MLRHISRALALLCIACALVALAGSGTAHAADSDTTFVPGEVIITTTGVNPDGATGSLRALMDRYGVSSIDPLGGNSSIYRLRFANGNVSDAVAAFATDPQVTHAEPDYLAHIEAAVALPGAGDPLYDRQWHLQKIDAPDAWSITTGSAAIKVAVIDTGIDVTHPDLAGKVVERNDLFGPIPAGLPPAATAEAWHGTAVASFITANTGNGQGLAGLNWNSSLIEMRLSPILFSFNIARALILAADHGARVANLSLGGPASTALIQALIYAESKGMVIVASAGNSGPIQGLGFPAAFPGVIAVSASDIKDTIAGFSSTGHGVSVAAPGAGVWGAYPGGSYIATNGTSFSSPIVAGVAALVLSVDPNLTPAQVKEIIEGTADDIDAPGYDLRAGWGRVNAYKAVLAAKNGDMHPNKHSTLTGKVTGVDPKDVVLSVDPFGWTIRPDALNPIFRLGADGTFTIPNIGHVTLNIRAAVQGAGTTGVAVVTLSGASGDNQTVNFAFQNVPGTSGMMLVDQARAFDAVAAPASSDLLYFRETSHTLGGVFRGYWQAHGGLAVFGFPLSQEFQEVTPRGIYTVQYFERNRLEYHPEAPPQYQVLLGLLGSESVVGRSFASPAAGTPAESIFVETGHSLSGRFREYWQANGGLPIFGFPISEPQMENGVLVQYFERARFELHPGNARPYDVLLGLLGRDLAVNRNYTSVR